MSTASGATTSCASYSSYASTAASRSRGYTRMALPSRRQSQLAAQALSHQTPMYIGPWQEFALGRALQPTAGRRSGRRRVPVEAAPTDTELNVLVHTFKELASQLDHEGAKNMLRFSPLFMPTMQGLLNPMGGADVGPPVMSQHRALSNVAELQQAAALRAADSLLPPAAERRRGGAGGATTVRGRRQKRVQQLQQMYSLGGGEAAGGRLGGGEAGRLGGAGRAQAAEAESAQQPAPSKSPSPVLPWAFEAERPAERPAEIYLPPIDTAEMSVSLAAVQAGAPLYLPPIDTAAARAVGSRRDSLDSVTPRFRGMTAESSRPPSVRAAMLESSQWSGGGAANLGDEWEDEVDGLIEWTKGLHTLA